MSGRRSGAGAHFITTAYGDPIEYCSGCGKAVEKNEAHGSIEDCERYTRSLGKPVGWNAVFQIGWRHWHLELWRPVWSYRQ